MLSLSGSPRSKGTKQDLNVYMFRGCVCVEVGGSPLGHRSPRSRPEGAVFGAGKSGRSLQCTSRGGACEYSCARASVRVARPGVACVTAIFVSMTRDPGAPQAARGGLKGNVLSCVSSASFP